MMEENTRMMDPNLDRAVQLIYKLNFDATEQHVRQAVLDMVNYHTKNAETIAEYIFGLQGRAGIAPMPAMMPQVAQDGQVTYVPQQHQQYAQPVQPFVQLPHMPQPYAPPVMPVQQPQPMPMPVAQPQPMPAVQPMPQQPVAASSGVPAGYPDNLPMTIPNPDQPYMGPELPVSSPVVGGSGGIDDKGMTPMASIVDTGLLDRTQFAPPVAAPGQVQQPAPQMQQPVAPVQPMAPVAQPPGGGPTAGFRHGDIPMQDVPAHPIAAQQAAHAAAMVPDYDKWERDQLFAATKERGIKTVTHMRTDTLIKKLKASDTQHLTLEQKLERQRQGA